MAKVFVWLTASILDVCITHMAFLFFFFSFLPLSALFTHLLLSCITLCCCFSVQFHGCVALHTFFTYLHATCIAGRPRLLLLFLFTGLIRAGLLSRCVVFFLLGVGEVHRWKSRTCIQRCIGLIISSLCINVHLVSVSW